MFKVTKLFFTLTWLVAFLVIGLWMAPRAYAATITVETTADNTSTADNACSLREAINNANRVGGGDGTSNNCESASNGSDTIVFASTLSGQTITLGSALPQLTSNITIDGTGSKITVSGNNAVQVFNISAGGNVTINNLTIVNAKNSANSSSAVQGGAINNAGTLTINNSTLQDNTVSNTRTQGSGNNAQGGAIANSGTLTIINSTFSGNSATVADGTARGSAIYASSGTVKISNSTIVGSVATGVDTAGGTTTIKNSIIKGHAGNDCVTATVQGVNRIDDGTNCGTFTSATNLGSLVDNGGDTQTIALLVSPSNSNAIDTATSCTTVDSVLITSDQRGVTRPLDGDNNSTATCDIGAFEYRRNTAPSFTKGADQSAFEDAGAQSVTGWATNISAGPFDEANQTLTFNVTNNNNALFSVQPSVDSTGKLTYTPAPNANGTALVTISLKDNGGTANGGSDTSASQTFNINVTAVNDAPSFTKGADQTVLEDAGAQSVTGWATSISAGPSDESGQTLTFNVTNNNNTLFSVQPSVDSTGKLTYTPAPNANGTALVTISLQDSGGTANSGVDTSASQTFNINVTAVNDAPSFAKGADQTVLEDAGVQSVPGWATSISAGPSDESGQTLTFNVTNNNNALFSIQPSVDATGKLTYTPAPNANGTALVTISLQDNGGTTNGGVDTSGSQTFNINVTAVNDAPDTSITAQPQNPTNSSSASFSFSGTDVEDGSVTNFECALDSDPFAACTSPQSYSNLSDGSHTFNVRAVDSGGSVDPSPATYTWVVDVTPPNTTIDTSPSDPSGSTTADFTFSSSEANSTFACSLDNAAFASCTSPKQYTGLSSGSHTFAVQATDAVGNTDASAASYTWQISLNSAPVATNDTPAQVVVGDGNAVLLDVLSNDTDPDAGQTLQIASVQSPSAQNGAVQISSNKASYTAPTHYSGVDTFTYTAQDSDPLNPLTSNSATVTVNVVANDARGDCNGDGGVDAADFPAIVLEIFDTDFSPDWWKTYTGDFVGSPRGCDANGTENSGGASVDASDLTCTVLIFFGDSCGVTNANAASTDQTATLQVTGNLAGAPGATVSAPIRLTTAGKAAAATAFTFHFDTTHFRFDSTDKDGNGLPDALHITAPARFTASVQTNGATGEINVALYGATLPLPALTDGVIATVDLQVVGVSDGQTPAVQLSNASLSDNQGQAMPLTVNNVDGQTSTLATLHLYLPIAAR